MPKASDLPILEASIDVYEDLSQAVERMRARASRVSDLLAIASIADEIHTRLRGLRLKRKKLAVVTSLVRS